jgi:hypothetical protein
MRRLLPSLAVLAAALLVAAPALARNGNDGRVLRSGPCTGPATWKLKAKPDDGRLEVEFEVDRNRSGLRYNVVLKRNGVTFATVSRTTGGRSGSFSVERRTANGAGTDRITAVATRTGERCSGALSI